MSKSLFVKVNLFIIKANRGGYVFMQEEALRYVGLVRSITSKYGFRSDYDDLFQAGMLGLQTALQKYDSSKETNFTDYAYLWIKGEVLKAVNNDYQVHIPSDIYKLSKDVKETREYLSQNLGREPTNSEIAYFLGIDEEKIISVMNAIKSPYSLDNNYLDDDYNLYSKIALIEKGYDVGVLDLKEAIMGLEESEIALITSRYYQDMTQKETADILGLSQVQVSRKESKILEKLKSKVA